MKTRRKRNMISAISVRAVETFQQGFFFEAAAVEVS